MKWLAALAGACLAATVQAQPLALPASPPTPPDRTVAVASDESARLIVPVTIAAQPWHFLIDTASTRSVIASDVADSLGLARGNALRVLTIAGPDTVPSVTIPLLEFSQFAARDIRAPCLLRSNLGGDGLLGLDILHNSRITIDFRQPTALTIAPSSREPDKNADPDTIVVVARSRMGELIVTNAEIDGIPVAVIIDTGSQGTVGNPALLGRLYRSTARVPLGPTTLIGVTGRSLPADYALVSKLVIGGVAIDNIPMAFGDAATFRQFGLVHRPAILLGMQTLRLFGRVTIDFPRRQIRFMLRHDAAAGHGR